MTDYLAASRGALAIAVDASRPVPLYQQLSEELRRMVITDNWPADSAIPSERELMRMTGLSRMTVRQAIDALTREGLLRRVHGRAERPAVPEGRATDAERAHGSARGLPDALSGKGSRDPIEGGVGRTLRPLL